MLDRWCRLQTHALQHSLSMWRVCVRSNLASNQHHAVGLGQTLVTPCILALGEVNTTLVKPWSNRPL
jgi:hypothetical protein